MTDAAPYPRLDGTQPCMGEDPEVFFPTSGNGHWTIPRALRACQQCPFRRDCLAYALTHAVEGIWGGTTKAERARLRSDFGLPPPEPTEATSMHTELHNAIDRLDDGTRSANDIARELRCSSKAIERQRTRRQLQESA